MIIALIILVWIIIALIATYLGGVADRCMNCEDCYPIVLGVIFPPAAIGWALLIIVTHSGHYNILKKVYNLGNKK